MYIDGGSDLTPIPAWAATEKLQALEASDASPWLNFGGIPAPYTGLFNSSGLTSALLDPNEPALGQASGLLLADIVPTERVTNLGQYGYALNSTTSPPSLAGTQAHIGKGVAAKGPVHGWDRTGAITPIKRFATMFSGYPLKKVDGTEWYFPQRLTTDSVAVGNGNANPAQVVLGLHATMGHELHKSLLIYAFGAQLGGASVPEVATMLAEQSASPRATSRSPTTRPPMPTTTRQAHTQRMPSSPG